MRLLHKMQFYISVIGKVSERHVPLAERPGLWKGERALLLALLARSPSYSGCTWHASSLLYDRHYGRHTLAHLCYLGGALDSSPGVRGHKLYQTVTLVLPKEFSHVKLGWSPPFQKFISSLVKAS